MVNVPTVENAAAVPAKVWTAVAGRISGEGADLLIVSVPLLLKMPPPNMAATAASDRIVGEGAAAQR